MQEKHERYIQKTPRHTWPRRAFSGLRVRPKDWNTAVSGHGIMSLAPQLLGGFKVTKAIRGLLMVHLNIPKSLVDGRITSPKYQQLLYILPKDSWKDDGEDEFLFLQWWDMCWDFPGSCHVILPTFSGFVRSKEESLHRRAEEDWWETFFFSDGKLHGLKYPWFA